jgi:hypothetical protein
MRLDRETGRYGTLSILSVTVPLYWNTTHEIKVPTYNVLRTRYRTGPVWNMVSGLQVIQIPVDMVDTGTYSTH